MKRLSSIVLSIAASVTVAGYAVIASAGDAPAADRSAATDAGDYPADNTGRNVRDRDDRTLTSEDQSEKKADRELTQKIRNAVVEDDSLSTSAHNVKIITVDGVVTLRGPVKSAKERNAVGAKAVKIAGAGKVKNQLEIAAE
jgi:hyperosmotically inducible protein